MSIVLSKSSSFMAIDMSNSDRSLKCDMTRLVRAEQLYSSKAKGYLSIALDLLVTIPT